MLLFLDLETSERDSSCSSVLLWLILGSLRGSATFDFSTEMISDTFLDCDRISLSISSASPKCSRILVIPAC